MNAFGVASSRRVNTGESRPKPMPNRATSMPATYWRSRAPEAEMIAFTGPVRQVDTEPTSAIAIEPAPQASVIALTGGLWPAAPSTAKPCPFCTTSTVIASGTTSSTIARQDHSMW